MRSVFVFIFEQHYFFRVYKFDVQISVYFFNSQFYGLGITAPRNKVSFLKQRHLNYTALSTSKEWFADERCDRNYGISLRYEMRKWWAVTCWKKIRLVMSCPRSCIRTVLANVWEVVILLRLSPNKHYRWRQCGQASTALWLGTVMYWA